MRTLRPVSFSGQIYAVYEDDRGVIVGEEIFNVRVLAHEFDSLVGIIERAMGRDNG